MAPSFVQYHAVHLRCRRVVHYSFRDHVVLHPMDIWGCDVMVVVSKAGAAGVPGDREQRRSRRCGAPHQGQCSTTSRWCDPSRFLANLPAVRSSRRNFSTIEKVRSRFRSTAPHPRTYYPRKRLSSNRLPQRLQKQQRRVIRGYLMVERCETANPPRSCDEPTAKASTLDAQCAPTACWTPPTPLGHAAATKT